MVLPCCGKKIGRIGTDFGISFLQTEASLKKARGSERERVTFECKTIYVVPLEFIYKGNIELHECPVKFWNYSSFVWPYLHINWVFGHLMCIIQIWTTSTCSRAPKLVEKSHLCPRVNFYSHAKNENKIQTSGHRGSVENIEKLGFKIMKLGMVSCHGSTMPW